MTDLQLYNKAANAYYRAHLTGEAVRCYRLGQAHRRAAELNVSLGDYREAAIDFERAGMAERAAWILADQVEDPGAARAVVANIGTAPGPGKPGSVSSPAASLPLPIRLILARCAITEGSPPQSIIEVIGDVCAELADSSIPYDRTMQAWAVALAEHVQRYDQAALIFAAAVRGRRPYAARYWNDWATRVLKLEADLIIPAVPEPPRPPAGD